MKRRAVSRALHLALLATVLLLSSPQLRAWGPEGHRIVGQIAADRLGPAARAAIATILVDEPEPTLAGVANWADEVRDERTGPLHYINFPIGDCHYQPPRDCPGGRCVVAAIDSAVLVLKDRKASAEQRRVALKQLVHFVGDVHQPLHGGRAEDRGGNTVQLQWRGEGSNLHKLWDVGLIEAIEPDWQRYVERLASKASGVELGPLAADAWAMESCLIVSAPAFYPADREPGPDYLTAWQGTVDVRLNLAGIRLAALLGTLFPG
ncbi:S1/P1 nuclease [Nevskia ramosa]|uniref:S1/P1 nuclease n=1 Tax=Nevskia ramosa TaxID=64002 RepID=UPI0003B39D5D|nr:S1/P1 nuclease [Nevskia ramosa]